MKTSVITLENLLKKEAKDPRVAEFLIQFVSIIFGFGREFFSKNKRNLYVWHDTELPVPTGDSVITTGHMHKAHELYGNNLKNVDIPLYYGPVDADENLRYRLGYLPNQKLWFTDKEENIEPLRNILLSEVTNSPREIPKGLAHMLSLHYEGSVDRLNNFADNMLSVSKTKQYKHLLHPPRKYKLAYRMMVKISADTLKKIIPDLKDQSSVVYAGGTYNPIAKVSSWTVSPKLFRPKYDLDDDLAFLPGTSTPFGTYIVFLEADLNKFRDKFLINPDKMLKHLSIGSYENQKEVISVGPIPLRRVFAIRHEPRKNIQVPKLKGLTGEHLANWYFSKQLSAVFSEFQKMRKEGI